MEVTAQRSVLYNGGNRQRAYLKLTFCSSLNREIAGEQLRITFEALAQHGGRGCFSRLLPTGAELATGETIELPVIRVRGAGLVDKPDLTRFLLSTDQAGTFRSEFGLTPEAMAGAYFRFVHPKLENPVHVAPSWPDLVDPGWESDLRAWVSDPARHSVPLPDRLPWSSLKNGNMFLPGVEGLVPYPAADIKGELRFVLAEGVPQAVFVRQGNENTAAYLLRWANNKIVAECREPASPQNPAAAPDAFDSRAFASLFEPADRTLLFSQVAGETYFSFHPFRSLNDERRKNIYPVALHLLFGKAAVQPGAACFFTGFRQEIERKLFIVCFADEAREMRLGWGNYNFDANNRIRNQHVTLDTGACPDVLRGWLEGKK